MDLMNYVNENEKNEFFKCGGPPEHWITALARMAWGVSEDRRRVWQNIKKGDIILFHTTRKSNLHVDSQYSGIVGVGVVERRWERDNEDLWWYAEFQSQDESDLWPLIIEFSDILTTCNPKNIDTAKHIQDKTRNEILEEIKYLTINKSSMAVYNEAAPKQFPQFVSVGKIDRLGAIALIEDMLPKLHHLS